MKTNVEKITFNCQRCGTIEGFVKNKVYYCPNCSSASLFEPIREEWVNEEKKRRKINVKRGKLKQKIKVLRQNITNGSDIIIDGVRHNLQDIVNGIDKEFEYELEIADEMYRTLLESEINKWLTTNNWPEWASHLCVVCNNHCVPDVVGGGNNFCPIISTDLVATFASFAVSGIANAATRSKPTLLCPTCKHTDLISLEDASSECKQTAYKMLPEEKRAIFRFNKKVNEKRTIQRNNLSFKHPLTILYLLFAFILVGIIVLASMSVGSHIRW